jgi:hypothetical protein
MMWAVASAPATLGLCLNTFVISTWLVGGKKYFKAVPFNLKAGIISGALYGLVDTLPVLVLGSDLPCDCHTEECTGTSILCAVNRCSIYLLLSILINLCAMTYSLYSTLESTSAMNKKKKGVMNQMCIVFPCLLTIAAYGMDTDDPTVPNAVLNVARHGTPSLLVYYISGFFILMLFRP